jgi:hypothetical protein
MGPLFFSDAWVPDDATQEQLSEAWFNATVIYFPSDKKQGGSDRVNDHK